MGWGGGGGGVGVGVGVGVGWVGVGWGGLGWWGPPSMGKTPSQKKQGSAELRFLICFKILWKQRATRREGLKCSVGIRFQTGSADLFSFCNTARVWRSEALACCGNLSWAASRNIFLPRNMFWSHRDPYNGGVPLFWWKKPCFKWAKCIF